MTVLPSTQSGLGGSLWISDFGETSHEVLDGGLRVVGCHADEEPGAAGVATDVASGELLGETGGVCGPAFGDGGGHDASSGT